MKFSGYCCTCMCAVVVAVVAAALYLRFGGRDADLERRYSELLEKYAEATATQDSGRFASARFAEAPSDTVWRTNGVFTVRDIRFYRVRLGVFSDSFELAESYPSRALGPGDCVCVRPPEQVGEHRGELLTFIFRNIKYCLFVNDGTWGYHIAGGRVRRFPETFSGMPDLSIIKVRERADFWRRDYYSVNLYVSRLMLSADEWLSAERNESGQCVVRFHAAADKGGAE